MRKVEACRAGIVLHFKKVDEEQGVQQPSAALTLRRSSQGTFWCLGKFGQGRKKGRRRGTVPKARVTSKPIELFLRGLVRLVNT